MDYWKLKVIGGPLNSMEFTHEDTLKDFENMQIQLENGGGVYVFKGVEDEDGDKYDLITLFSGIDGSSTTRNTVKQLY